MHIHWLENGSFWCTSCTFSLWKPVRLHIKELLQYICLHLCVQGVLKVSHTDSGPVSKNNYISVWMIIQVYMYKGSSNVLSLCSFTSYSKRVMKHLYLMSQASLHIAHSTVQGCWAAGLWDHMCTATSLSHPHISFITSYNTEAALWLWLNRLCTHRRLDSASHNL